VIREYVHHYNRGRLHPGLGLDIHDPSRSSPAEGRVVCHARLGGVINELRSPGRLVRTAPPPVGATKNPKRSTAVRGLACNAGSVPRVRLP
jgi:hypothetical protein